MKIEIPQLKRQIPAEADANLLAILVKAKVPIAHSCAGDGVCGTCVVKIWGEENPPLSERELRLMKKQGRELKPGCHFACLVKTPDSSKTWVITTEYW